MSQYSQDNGRFPKLFDADDLGQKKHSWRPTIFFLVYHGTAEYPQSYDFNQPWDGKDNSKLSLKSPGFMQCPSRARENPQGSPFVMINDFGETPVKEIPANAVLVLEAWDANRNWLDPCDKVQTSPRIQVEATDHPSGIGVILRDFSVTRVKDTGRIKKVGSYYVLDR